MERGLEKVDLQTHEVSEFSFANEFRKHAKALNTINARLSDWEDFCCWCQQRSLSYLPAEPKTVGEYLADRAANKWHGPSGKYKEQKEKAPLKLNSLQRRLSTISVMHQRYNITFKRKDPFIMDVLAGIRRLKGTFESRKTPILIEDMRKIVELLPQSITGIRDKALLLIGFAGALRRAELASICLEDLTFPKEGLEILFKWSKTGGRSVLIPFGSNPMTCPIRALKDWLEMANITEGPIFRPINRHGQIQPVQLTDRAIALIIKKNKYLKQKIIEASDQEMLDYSGHSLRAGFVTTAIQNGVPEHLIMNQTGHKKSDTVKKYIRLTNKWKDNAASRIGL